MDRPRLDSGPEKGGLTLQLNVRDLHLSHRHWKTGPSKAQVVSHVLNKR